MKRLLVLTMLLFGVTVLSAQPYKVTSCFNHMRYNEIKLAKEAIDPAILDSKTSQLQRCWLCYGMVYKAISDSCMFNKNNEYCDLDKDALEKSYTGFMKAWALNFKNPEHQKLDIKDSVDYFKFMGVISNPETKYLDQQYQTDIFFNLAGLTNSFVNKGLIQYQDQDYAGSATTFETALFLSALQTMIDAMLNQEEPIIDSEIIYFAALANDQAKNHKKSKELYKQLLQLEYGKNNTEKAKIYVLKAYAEKNIKDTVAYVKTLEKGIEVYPDESFILVELINHYIELNDGLQAKEMIKRAIVKDPENKLLHFNIGTIYDNEGNKEDAEKSYLKAIEIDTVYFDAVYNLGAMFVNMGVEKNDICDEIPPDKTADYKACKAKVMEIYKKALPHLEKAYEINPKDIYTLTNLRSLYANFKDVEKYEKVKKELEELQKK